MIMQYHDILKRWQAWNIQSADDLDLYLEQFRILFAYHSGKIENERITYQDTRNIFTDGKASGYTGDSRTLFEIQGQKVCYDLLKDKIIAKEPLSIPLFLDTHYALTAGTYDARRYMINHERPGTFKKHDYVIGKNEVGSPPEAVEEDLLSLLEEMNSIGERAPLKAGAYFHARFEVIHPFADGNGRTGRSLLNYWLMINRYPPIVIFDEDKYSYYTALQSYEEDETIEPLFTFLKDQTIKTWTGAMGPDER